MANWNRKMWFGTRGHERWIPMPMTGAEFVRVGSNSKVTNLNGGARVRKSKGSHMEYTMDFGTARSRAELRPILDFHSGAFDDNDGVNLVYFITPEAADVNVAPEGLAFPGQQGMDAMPVTTNNKRPTLVASPVNTLGYPARSAFYTFAGTETARKTYFPIPPGFVAWIGVHGTATGSAGYRVIPWNGITPAAGVNLTLLDVTDPVRMNYSVDSASYSGFELQARTGAGTLTHSGTIIQILPQGITPDQGGWLSGQGHSGCEFEGPPVQTIYQVTDGSEAIGMTARLIETGDYL